MEGLKIRSGWAADDYGSLVSAVFDFIRGLDHIKTASQTAAADVAK